MSNKKVKKIFKKCKKAKKNQIAHSIFHTFNISYSKRQQIQLSYSKIEKDSTQKRGKKFE